MPATTAATTGRRALRASAIALGLLVSAGVLAPPALATPPPAADPTGAAGPGPSGSVHVQLAAAPAPADLDLSGARFDVLDASGAVLGSCDTAASGACDVPLVVSAGASPALRLVQEAGSPVPGLVPSAAETPVVLCSPGATGCADPAVTVTDGSLFRTALLVTVRDGGTQAPVAGAEYSLTGPDYRHVSASPQEAETTVFPDPALSGPDGRLTFAGWFLPGEWTLIPEVTPRAYQSSGGLPVTLPASSAGSGDPWVATVGLAPSVVAVTVPSGPERPPVGVPRPRGSTAPATTPGAARRPPAPRARSWATASATPTVPSSAAPATTLAAPVPPAVPSEPRDAVPAPVRDDTAATPPVAAPAPATASPPLRAAASAYRLDVGEIAFGVLFLASVMVGVGVVRRRLRQR